MKIAIILHNLGGPDALESVRPFLFNLFRDKAIIRLPALLRYPLAALISARREKEAQHIYAAIGGKSPLLENTRAQGAALERLLNIPQPLVPPVQFRVFTAMRYWHPLPEETAKEVADFAPDRIVELPLYPQFSTTTTQSSFDAFAKAAVKYRITAPREPVTCYPVLPGFINAQTALIAPLYQKLQQDAVARGIKKPPRILFSCHGLPQRVIDAGDPYQWQCEQTAKAILAALNIPQLDFKTTYQSRVGPMQWITPYTDAEILQAGKDGVPLLIAPIAFVSEHSETLYELDQQYRDLAAANGVPLFARAPAVSTHPLFIEGLAGLVRAALANGPAPSSCPPALRACGCRRNRSEKDQ
jgi:ferrochelatase